MSSYICKTEFRIILRLQHKGHLFMVKVNKLQFLFVILLTEMCML